MHSCCPPRHGCNSAGGREPCALVLCRVFATVERDAALVVTGILLAIARVAGETAPLVFTILGSQYFFSGLNSPMDALPIRIYRLALLPYPYAQAQGWGAALVLILMVLVVNIGVRLATRGRLYTTRSRA